MLDLPEAEYVIATIIGADGEPLDVRSCPGGVTSSWATFAMTCDNMGALPETAREATALAVWRGLKARYEADAAKRAAHMTNGEGLL